MRDFDQNLIRSWLGDISILNRSRLRLRVCNDGLHGCKMSSLKISFSLLFMREVISPDPKYALVLVISNQKRNMNLAEEGTSRCPSCTFILAAEIVVGLIATDELSNDDVGTLVLVPEVLTAHVWSSVGLCLTNHKLAIWMADYAAWSGCTPNTHASDEIRALTLLQERAWLTLGILGLC